MDAHYKRITLDQVDKTLRQFKSLVKTDRPSRGWIRAIRMALGMSGPQLASRLGISQPAVFALEKSEANYKITLKSLIKAAEALDCTVVYALVPDSSLKEMIRTQATRKAENQVMNVSHTMMLENQLPDDSAVERQTSWITRELIENLPNTLWNE